MIPEDPKAASTYLEELAVSPATPETFAEVVEALRHKREGIQVCAARTLAKWNDPIAVKPLREWLLASLNHPESQSCAHSAAQSLARLVGAGDAAWVLDLYFGKTNPLQKDSLLPLVAALPPSEARVKIREQFHSDLASNREAAVRAAFALSFADLPELLRQLATDPSPEVSNLVAVIMKTVNTRAV